MTEQDRPQLPADLQQLLGIEARPVPIVLTRGKKALIAAVAGFVTIIAGIGFAGSYNAVTRLAASKGFGWFAWAFPAGIDSGIGGFLALDLLLTWLRIPYPLLRPAAWLLTVATIAFNSSAAWGDPVAVGMHATIPLLFVVAIEAARHAVGRIADITADRHIESPPLIRWFIAPWPTFRIWRRMRLWQITSYGTVVKIEQDARVLRVKLRRRYGRKWRRTAGDHELLALTLVHYGTPVAATLAEHEAAAGRSTDAMDAAPEALPADATERPAEPLRSATDGATERPAVTPQGAPVDATVDAAEALRKTLRPRPVKRPKAPARGAARDAIKALYTKHGRRPLESEMVEALKAIRSKYTSRQYANKIRIEIERDHPELAALGSDNVRTLTGT